MPIRNIFKRHKTLARSDFVEDFCRGALQEGSEGYRIQPAFREEDFTASRYVYPQTPISTLFEKGDNPNEPSIKIKTSITAEIHIPGMPHKNGDVEGRFGNYIVKYIDNKKSLFIGHLHSKEGIYYSAENNVPEANKAYHAYLSPAGKVIIGDKKKLNEGFNLKNFFTPVYITIIKFLHRIMDCTPVNFRRTSSGKIHLLDRNYQDYQDSYSAKSYDISMEEFAYKQRTDSRLSAANQERDYTQHTIKETAPLITKSGFNVTL